MKDSWLCHVDDELCKRVFDFVEGQHPFGGRVELTALVRPHLLHEAILIIDLSSLAQLRPFLLAFGA